MGKKSKKIGDASKLIRQNNNPAAHASFSSQLLTNNPLVHIACIIFLIIIIYANTLSAPFLWDEHKYIVDNPIIKDLHYFTSPSDAKGFIVYGGLINRYIGYLTFALNYKINGLSVTGYHIVNIAIHITSSILVYLLVLLTFRTPFFAESSIMQNSRYIAFFSSLLFAVHPLQTEAVTYIFQRFASLVAFFYLLSLTAYIQSRLSEGKLQRVFFYGIAFISALLAMKTKENAFTLPLVITLYEFCFFKDSMKKRAWHLAPILLTLTIVPLTLMSTTGTQQLDPGAYGAKEFSQGDYFFTQFRVIVTYLRLLFFPVNQNIDYDYPIFTSFFDLPVILSFLVLSALFGLGIYLIRSSRFTFHVSKPFRLMGFGILWFFITLSVESSIIPIPMIIDEYRVYLPSVGMIICTATFIFLLKGKVCSPKAGRIILVSLVLAAGVLAVATYHRNEMWGDTIRLWEDAAEKSPARERVHNNLGTAYASQGQLDRAISEFQTALRLKPNYAEAHYNLGLAYKLQGQLDRAIPEYQAALRLKPDYAEAHNNLGIEYASQGQLDRAISEYQAALQLKPSFAEAHNNLGIGYASQGQLDRAISEFQAALRLKPEYIEAHNNLGIEYASQGQLDRAISEYQAALRLKPDFYEVRQRLNDIVLRRH